MDVRGESGLAGAAFENLPGALGGEPAAMRAEEDMSAGDFLHQSGPFLREIDGNGFACLAADRNDAGFVPLAGHPDESLVEVQVFEAGADEFRDAKSAPVEEFEHRAVPRPERAVGGDGFDQPRKFGRREGLGQITFGARRHNVGRRVRSDVSASEEEPEKNPP